MDLSGTAIPTASHGMQQQISSESLPLQMRYNSNIMKFSLFRNDLDE